MRRTKYTRELLEPIVRESLSIAQVLKRLKLKPTGGNYRNIQLRIRLLNLSVEHFRGMGWSRGETADSHPTVALVTRKITLTDEQVFTENSPLLHGRRIIRRLLRMGWQYRCAACGIDSWNGKPISLHLEHVNGIPNDNRLENLKLLCPNCHSQTRTYCRKKICLHKAR